METSIETIRVNTVDQDVTEECAVPTRDPDTDLETIQKKLDRLG
jgi:hypothetical protein